MKNPNAAVAGGTSGAGVLLVWILGNVFHVDLSAELGAAIAGAASAAVLFIGREGISGLWHTIWRGSSKPPAAPPAVPPPG